MDEIFNITNLKSSITFIHLAGLALEVGGAWTLDLFIVKHLEKHVVTREKYQVIEFISQLVMIGLALLWMSGSMFILYYSLFEPALLSNQKVWAKVFIVSVLSINGFFVHKALMPKLEACIGGSLLAVLDRKEIRLLVSIGTVSFVSWVVPIVLGVTKTLNFTVPGVTIVMVYLYAAAVALLLAEIVANVVIASIGKDEPDFPQMCPKTR